MGQSLIRNYVHLVFSTKFRQKIILPPFDEELFKYLGGICKQMDCQSIITGGYTDHVHILCMLSKQVRLMDLLQEVKGSSSKWFKTKDKSLSNFYWQNGYGAFSVTPDSVEIVKSYIANQKEHHSKVSFQDEYRRFLEEYKIEYDERYVWD